MKVHELIKQLQEYNPEAIAYLVEKTIVNDGDGYMDELENHEAVQKVTKMSSFMIVIT